MLVTDRAHRPPGDRLESRNLLTACNCSRLCKISVVLAKLCGAHLRWFADLRLSSKSRLTRQKAQHDNTIKRTNLKSSFSLHHVSRAPGVDCQERHADGVRPR